MRKKKGKNETSETAEGSVSQSFGISAGSRSNEIASWSESVDVEGPFVLNKTYTNIFVSIFDLTKPDILENEFIQFMTCSSLRPYFQLKKTSSRFMIIAKNAFGQKNHITSTHWPHQGDPLDWHFISNVRDLMIEQGITPETVVLQ